MSNNVEKIYNAFEYAKENNINPVDPETWDESYKKRQQELAGIIPEIEETEKKIALIKEGINNAKKLGIIKK